MKYSPSSRRHFDYRLRTISGKMRINHIDDLIVQNVISIASSEQLRRIPLFVTIFRYHFYPPLPRYLERQERFPRYFIRNSNTYRKVIIRPGETDTRRYLLVFRTKRKTFSLNGRRRKIKKKLDFVKFIIYNKHLFYLK